MRGMARSEHVEQHRRRRSMIDADDQRWIDETCERTTAAQGLPLYVENAATLARLADALKRSQRRSEAVRDVA
jgi:hypothetical protein